MNFFFNPPSEIVTDRGGNFMSKILNNYLDLLIRSKVLEDIRLPS